MIERIPDLPDTVLGFTAKGTVTADDYESVITPAVDAQRERQGKIRLLYHLGKDFSGFDAGAMWDDAKVGLAHPASWEKVAVVSDAEWLQLAVKALGFAMPGDFRVFHDGELAEAKRWICE